MFLECFLSSCDLLLLNHLSLSLGFSSAFPELCTTHLAVAPPSPVLGTPVQCAVSQETEVQEDGGSVCFTVKATPSTAPCTNCALPYILDESVQIIQYVLFK